MTTAYTTNLKIEEVISMIQSGIHMNGPALIPLHSVQIINPNLISFSLRRDGRIKDCDLMDMIESKFAGREIDIKFHPDEIVTYVHSTNCPM